MCGGALHGERHTGRSTPCRVRAARRPAPTGSRCRRGAASPAHRTDHRARVGRRSARVRPTRLASAASDDASCTRNRSSSRPDARREPRRAAEHADRAGVGRIRHAPDGQLLRPPGRHATIGAFEDGARRARGRAPRSPSPAGWPRSRPRSSRGCRPAPLVVVAGRRVLGRRALFRRAARARAGSTVRRGRHRRHRRRARRAARRRPAVARDGDQPAAGRRRPAGCSPPPRTRPARCVGVDATFSTPLVVAAARPRRRRRHALGHEVPRRALGPADGRAGRPRSPSSPPRCATRRHLTGGDPGRARGLPRHCAACAPSPLRMERAQANAAELADAAGRAPGGDAGALPGAGRPTPGTRSRARDCTPASAR